MAAEDYTPHQYNELLLLAECGPVRIEPFNGDNFNLIQNSSSVITYGDYEHVAKRAYQILKENGLNNDL